MYQPELVAERLRWIPGLVGAWGVYATVWVAMSRREPSFQTLEPLHTWEYDNLSAERRVASVLAKSMDGFWESSRPQG